jgi:predicted O-methyltransferase YrrM
MNTNKILTDSTALVHFCFNGILGRKCNEAELTYWMRALKAGAVSREQIFIELLSSKESLERQANQEFVPPGHFYSAIPSKQDRMQFLRASDESNPILGINMNDVAQIELLKKLTSYGCDYSFPRNKSAGFRYHWDNPAYHFADGLSLFSMIRHFQPNKIVEIGSGFSSCMILDVNSLFFKDSIHLTFVEPHPDLLYSLIKPEDVSRNTIIQMRLQDANIEVFSALEENDILFIDSTHVSKLKSDVNRAIFQVLPILKPGVIVHFHDIFWPFEYPKHWIEEGRAWNEIYIIRAFLEYNDSFEILLFPSYLQKSKPDILAAGMPDFSKGEGATLWLRKIK